MRETRSILLNLIVHEICRQYPELLPKSVTKPDYLRHATASNDLKLSLLDTLYNSHGPEAIIRIGFNMHVSGFSPGLDVLVSADNPIAMLEKWVRIEKASNIRFRIKFENSLNQRAVFIQHYAVDGDPPVLVEDLLICGVQIALIEAIGCNGVRCSVVAADGEESLVYSKGQIIPGVTVSNSAGVSWRISWTSIDNNRTETAMNLDLLSDYEDLEGLIAHVLCIIGEDVSRNWKIEEVAAELNLSKRSLQRYLHDLDVSFSLLKFAVKIHSASKLLSENELTITQISHQCGFSDSAHFSRLFSESAGFTPSKFRNISLVVGAS